MNDPEIDVDEVEQRRMLVDVTVDGHIESQPVEPIDSVEEEEQGEEEELQGEEEEFQGEEEEEGEEEEDLEEFMDDDEEEEEEEEDETIAELERVDHLRDAQQAHDAVPILEVCFNYKKNYFNAVFFVLFVLFCFVGSKIGIVGTNTGSARTL